MNPFKLALPFLFCAVIASAQLIVTVSPVKFTGQKAIVSLAMTNGLAETLESAHAVCFLFDDQGKMLGQSSKWVIGGTKDRLALQPNGGTTFNFVVTVTQPFTKTNLTAKVNFNRLILDDGELSDIKKAAQITSSVQ